MLDLYYLGAAAAVNIDTQYEYTTWICRMMRLVHISITLDCCWNTVI